MKLSARCRTALSVPGVALAAAATLWPIQSTFEVAADTEYLRIRTAPWASHQWSLGDGTLEWGDPPRLCAVRRIQLAPGSTLTFQRVANAGLLLGMDDGSAGSGVGRATLEDGQTVDLTVPSATLVVDVARSVAAGRRPVFLVEGELLELGREIGDRGGSIPLLTSGNVEMFARSLLGNQRFSCGRQELTLGDSVVLRGAATSSRALITSDTNPGLSLVLRGIAQQAVVRRFASKDYGLAVTPFERLKHDPWIQAIWIAAGAALVASSGAWNWIRGRFGSIRAAGFRS